MEYISAKEIASNWNISQRRVAILCSEGRVENAKLVGNMWIIPRNTKKPLDARTATPKENVKPFLKWAGGKGQLLNEISKYYPFENDRITKYAEPFVGGGAVFFDILSKYDLKKIYINDINEDLINAYRIIRDNVEELIEILRQYQKDYLQLNHDKRQKKYLFQRELYNSLKVNDDLRNNIEKAALLIFLNKTCFNGLYRVNKNGQFNVPMGSYKNPLICDEDNLRAISRQLQKVTIECGDYKNAEKFIDKHTFVYFDPPYRPLTETSSFTAYTEGDFTDKEQKELAKFVDKLDKKGAKIVVSNSDPKNSNKKDNFLDDIYSKHNISRVPAKRTINSNAKSRGEINELLISNFK